MVSGLRAGEVGVMVEVVQHDMALRLRPMCRLRRASLQCGHHCLAREPAAADALWLPLRFF